MSGNSLTVATTRQLRNLILNGELRAGDRLHEERLAAELAVSRGPLRLALDALEDQGYVRHRESGGFVVRSFDLRQVADAIALRGVLEGSAARLTARRSDAPGRLDALSTCLIRIDELLDRGATLPYRALLKEYARLNDAFHGELIVAAGSEPLQRAYLRLTALSFTRPSAFILALTDQPDLVFPIVSAHEHHRGILDAIRRGDGDAAERLATDHARLPGIDLREAVDHGDGLETLPGRSLIPTLVPS